MIRKTAVNSASCNGTLYDLDSLRLAIQRRLIKEIGNGGFIVWSSHINENAIVYDGSIKADRKRLDGKAYIEFALRVRFNRMPVTALSFASGTKYDALKDSIRSIVLGNIEQVLSEL